MMTFLLGVSVTAGVLVVGDHWFDLDLWLLNRGSWVFLTGAGFGAAVGALLTMRRA